MAAIASGSVSSSDNRLTLTGETVSALAEEATRAKADLEGLLAANNVALNKPITILIRILWQDMDAGSPCQLTLNEALLEAMGDCSVQILLGDGQHYVRISSATLRTLLSGMGTLSIQLSRGEDNTYALSFLNGEGQVWEQLPAGITLGLPAAGPMSTIMVSYGGQTDNWGGQYDPANRSISFETPWAGQYQVLENDVAISDIDGLSEESRTAIAFLVSRGYLTLKDGSFRPDEPLTRYEFTQALVGMFFALDRSLSTTFIDVPADNPFYPYVASGQARGIVTGLPDNTFGGDLDITVEQLLALATRTLIQEKGYAEPDDPDLYLSAFSDGDEVSDWARAQAAMAVRDGLLDRGGLLSPTAPTTREQAAVTLYRLFLLLYEVPPVALELPPVAQAPTFSPVPVAGILGGGAAAAAVAVGIYFLRKKQSAA